MIAPILILISLAVILFMAAVGIVISFHFRKFGLPEDPMAKCLMRVFEIGSLFLALFNVVLLAINIWKK